MRTVYDLMSLRGRAALVTGAAGHIGFEIAQALAEAGASIALSDLNAEKLAEKQVLLKKQTNNVISTHCIELSNESALKELPQTVFDMHGSLDILVNCAAFVGTSSLEGWAVPFLEQSSQAWRQAMEVNVTAAFILAQSAYQFLKISGHGSIINVSSIYGSHAPDWSLYEGTQMANPAAYGVSKAGLNQLTRWLASVMAPSVRVNTLSPGGVFREQPAAFVSRYEAKTPMKRMAVEEDFKGAAVFLASDLSSYVTGDCVNVDGGWGII